MEGTNSRPIYIPIDQTEALASGLWGSVSRVKGQNLVMKIAKNANDGLFETEKRIFERLGESDLIARYYGVATAQMGKEEKSSLLFQYYPSGSLRDFLNNPTSLEVRKCRKQQLRWAAQLLKALILVHSNNIIHGDVGIHNILVGEKYNLMLTDFGGSSIDGTDMLIESSPRYHRPHSWRFPIPGVDNLAETWKMPSRTMDTFALGTVLYEIFTGAELYKDETYDQIRQHATRREYPDLNTIDVPVVRAVIAKCWNERYGNVEQIYEDLHPVWEANPTTD